MSCGVFVFIVRNFRIGKSFLPFPTRFWTKNTLPLSSMTMSRERISHTGMSMTAAMNAMIRSAARFMKCLYIHRNIL